MRYAHQIDGETRSLAEATAEKQKSDAEMVAQAAKLAELETSLHTSEAELKEAKAAHAKLESELSASKEVAANLLKRVEEENARADLRISELEKAAADAKAEREREALEQGKTEEMLTKRNMELEKEKDGLRRREEELTEQLRAKEEELKARPVEEPIVEMASKKPSAEAVALGEKEGELASL
ncbi:MAG: hypothetical protein P4L67_02250 [Candidatus Pacebacteria bacterium]|nr:hypothetical protein [Candidatus Paceibacterota bacterium]